MVSPWKVGYRWMSDSTSRLAMARAAHVGHAHAEHQRVHQVAHHHVLALDRLVLGEPVVGVEWVVVHGDHAEEVVVGLGDRLARPVPVDVAGRRSPRDSGRRAGRRVVMAVVSSEPVPAPRRLRRGPGLVVNSQRTHRAGTHRRWSSARRSGCPGPGDGPEIHRQRHVDGRSFRDVLGRSPTVNSPRTSTGCVPSGVSIEHGPAIGVFEEELPKRSDASASCQSTSILSATALSGGRT